MRIFAKVASVRLDSIFLRAQEECASLSFIVTERLMTADATLNDMGEAAISQGGLDVG